MWLNFRINFTVGISPCIFLIGPPFLPSLPAPHALFNAQIICNAGNESRQKLAGAATKDQECYVKIKTAKLRNYICRSFGALGDFWISMTAKFVTNLYPSGSPTITSGEFDRTLEEVFQKIREKYKKILKKV